VSTTDPFDASYVVTRPQLTADDLTNIIREYVMILGPAPGIPHDPFEDTKHFNRLHAQPGFLKNLPANRLIQAFAGFD
jgi:hypothetical protein